MSVEYNDTPQDSQSYMMSTDMNARIYDGGTSSESSASSPLNGYDGFYGGTRFMPYPGFPMQFATGDYQAPIGLIPVELDIEGLYEERDRRRKKAGNDKVVASHVHSRRRAQNRASQRAFRDRKEKHMRDLELQLSELEGKHNDLSRSYESLQLEYSSVKDELDRLRRENARLESAAASSASSSSSISAREFQSHHGHHHSQSSSHREWDESKISILDPLLFDVSAFCFDQEDGDERKD